MQIITARKKILSVGVLMFILAFSFFVFNISSKFNGDFEIKNVLAEDDEDESEDEGEGEDEEKEIQKATSETSYEQISDNVRKETIKTTLFDSDRDGVFDNEDAHPTINDFFIVKDDDKNGVVDKYEQ